MFKLLIYKLSFSFGKRPIDLVNERLEQKPTHKTTESEQYEQLNRIIQDAMDKALSASIVSQELHVMYSHHLLNMEKNL